MLVIALGAVITFMNRLRRPDAAARLESWLVGDQPKLVDHTQPASPDTFRATPVVNDGDSQPVDYFAGVRPEALTAIRDNTQFRMAEAAAWFQLLSVLQSASSQQLAAAAVGEVDYAQLVDQPHVYRARLVTVRGTVRQVTTQRPAANDLGLESYYRLVIQPRSGGVWPIFVYALALPDDFPQGEDVAADVAVTGFFFKNLSYPWSEGFGIAPVVLAKTVDWPVTEEQQDDTPDPARTPTAADGWIADGEGIGMPAPGNGAQWRELLALAGWDAERLAGFRDGQPLSDAERQSLLALLWRLRTLDSFTVAAWTRNDLSGDVMVQEPAPHRGELMRLTGRVRRVERHALPAEDAARLEMPEYYECGLELEDDAGTAVILTARVPQAWLELDTLNEPASASAVFIKRLSASDEPPVALLVSPSVAWHPTSAREPHVSLGRSLLGTLGVDVGLLDGIQNRNRILSAEREAFYQELDAVGRVGPIQLIRFAQNNLDDVRQAWAAEAQRLPATNDAAPSADAGQRRLLAEEVLRKASEGQYSVAPLFNDADRQIGRLLVLDGVVRRVVRVEVGTSTSGEPSDVRQRFGLDHYYEMELFTDDSQNNPIVFCVRRLPAGFPTGGKVHVPVRVAGFFFKSWLYHTRPVPDDQTLDPSTNTLAPLRFAPLLISPGPVRLQEESAPGSPYAGLVGGGLFVLALAGIWAAAWWYARGDRAFRRRVLADNYVPPEGQSLDDLELPTGGQTTHIVDEPDQDKAGGS